jgi:hypothetical protein
MKQKLIKFDKLFFMPKNKEFTLHFFNLKKN